MRELFIIAYLLAGILAALLAAFYYAYGADIPRAVFWLVMAIGCDVAIIRREMSK